MNSMLIKDGYKVGHIAQYPEETQVVYNNFTPRGSRIKGIDHVVSFGLQYFIKHYLIEDFKTNFFSLEEDVAVSSYKRVIDGYLGPDAVDFEHIRDLHKLGFLPLHIKALPEGTLVPMRVPMFTVENTDTRFGWLPNVIETIASCTIWGPTTSATQAYHLRQLLNHYSAETGSPGWFTDFQAHDFSMRGMFGLEAAQMSGAGHLLSFKGTDTIPAITFLEKYYGASNDEKLIGASVAATEHSVMCMGGKETEEETYRRLLEDVYPTGILSVVSDTWDFWKVITETIPALHDVIMAREGKLVIRPDSGDPVDIICGTVELSYDNETDAADDIYDLHEEEANTACEGSYNCGMEQYTTMCEINGDYFEATTKFEYNRHDKEYYYIDNYSSGYGATVLTAIAATPEMKGLIKCLWDQFGGLQTDLGYNLLDDHIGAIYGDSITYDRAETILSRLKDSGFASANIVFGIGSYTYQYVTRDTFGFAMKATAGMIAGKNVEIFKDPKTDDGLKKSAKGFLKVIEVEGELTLIDQLDHDDHTGDIMNTIFLDNVMPNEVTLEEIRNRLKGEG